MTPHGRRESTSKIRRIQQHVRWVLVRGYFYGICLPQVGELLVTRATFIFTCQIQLYKLTESS